MSHPDVEPQPDPDPDAPDASGPAVEPVEPGVGDGDEEWDGEYAEERRYPSTIGGMFYLLVLAGAGAGIAIVWSGDWRLGVQVVGGALIVDAGLRLVLPARDAGMLKVRHRLFDVLLLSAVGAILIFLALTIPDQPG